ncbi:MAG: indolepyruvate oxidoreductase subunit beta [Deferribacterales bacterium]|nr:indolepyruvate oxidoreductase subunit beta [Deferribacterales bacterium]
MVKNIIMAGVGGQGIILASNIACAAFLEAGFDVKKSEIHGMAQRGGSVMSHVRFGDKVYSPVVSHQGADVVVSFEHMEFLRYMGYVNEKTTLILNTRKILPPSVAMGTAQYPDSLIDDYKGKFAQVYEIEADKIAAEAGNIKAAGMPLLGELCKILGMDKEIWENVIRSSVPPKTLDINIKAFRSVF